jgi:hypothetical protein
MSHHGAVRSAGGAFFSLQGRRQTVKQKMLAEILFLERRDLRPGITALESLGFKVETLDWVDPFSDETVWIIARIESELDRQVFFHWVHDIVEQRLQGADLVKAGPADPQQAA